MVADLHCHFFPAQAASSAGTSVEVELVGGTYQFVAASQSMRLDPGLVDLDRHIEDMNRQGVSHRALAIPPFTLQYELPVNEGVRWARSINDGIADAIRPYHDHFGGLATVPLQDVSAAIEELDRAINQVGLHGIEIATNINGVELDAPSLDPFWQRAEALRIPILVHPHYVAGSGRMGDYHLRNLIGNPAETALAGARLLFGGVLERFPDLRIILSHGGGALLHLTGRLRHGHDVRDETKVRASAPIEHLSRLYYDTIVFDAVVLRHVVEAVGASQIVLGTDYPFDMSETDPIGFVRGAGLTEEDMEVILENGGKLLKEVRRVAKQDN